MEPYFSDGQVTLYLGHVLDVLRGLPDESVQCVVTSPPYWALRAYGTEPQVWGGDSSHAHTWAESRSLPQQGGPSAKQQSNVGSWHMGAPIGECPCGAWRGELGHEPMPQMFVAHLVEVFREVRRVLKPDGVCWVNIGDSYNNRTRTRPSSHQPSLNGIVDEPWAERSANGGIRMSLTTDGLKEKDLVLIPERFALAMQDDGWYIRSRIAWCKRAPMPESVRDRPTNAWEHIWMMTKSARYYWDADAVKEAQSEGNHGLKAAREYGYRDPGTRPKSAEPGNGIRTNDSFLAAKRDVLLPNGRNMWSYWLLSPDPEPLAHFATFPREIPRGCIAAATSERGECPHCGKSWVRVVERGALAGEAIIQDGERPAADVRGVSPSSLLRTNGRTHRESKSVGWQPQCQCPPHEPRPSTVLDPFCGSGTTNQVARAMGRYSIGIDLSEPYLRDIALKKNAQMGLMVPAEPVA